MTNTRINTIKLYIEKESTKCNSTNLEIRRIPVNWNIGTYSQNEISLLGRDYILNPDYESLINLIHKTIPYLIDCTYTLSWKDSDDDIVVFASTDEFQHALNQCKDLFKLYVNKTPHLKDVTAGPIHPDVRCDGCHQEVKGDRFKCTVCYDYDLCHSCQCRGVHDNHDMLCIRLPGGLANYPCLPQTPVSAKVNKPHQSSSNENFMNFPQLWKGGKPWHFGPGGRGGMGGRCPPQFVKQMLRNCQWKQMYNNPPSNDSENNDPKQPAAKKARKNKSCCSNSDSASQEKEPSRQPEINSCFPEPRFPRGPRYGGGGGPPFGNPFGPPSWARRSGPPPMGPYDPYKQWPSEWNEYGKEGLGCGAGGGIAPRDPIDMTTEEDDGADCEEDAPTATTAAGGESATDNYSSLQCKCGARGPNRCVCSQEVRRNDLPNSQNNDDLPPCCSPANQRSKRDNRTPSCCKK